MYVSMGTTCLPAGLLKTMGLKHVSYPFDWLNIKNLSIVSDIIEDNFDKFLDRSLYYKTDKTSNTVEVEVETATGAANTIIGHKLYGKIFHHKNPLENQSDYEYYTRCVSRFRNLDPETNIVFLINTTSLAGIDRLCSIVKSRYRQYQIIVLHKVIIRNRQKPHITTNCICDEYRLVTYYLNKNNSYTGSYIKNRHIQSEICRLIGTTCRN